MFSYSVRIKKIQNPKGKIVAFASLIIDDVMEIDGFKVINGSNGLFVSAPQHKGKDKDGGDTWYEDVRFVGDSKDAVKEEVHKAVIAAFNRSGGSTRAAAAQSQVAANNPAPAAPAATGREPLW